MKYVLGSGYLDSEFTIHLDVYVRTYIHCTYIHTYIHTYIYMVQLMTKFTITLMFSHEIRTKLAIFAQVHELCTHSKIYLPHAKGI